MAGKMSPQVAAYPVLEWVGFFAHLLAVAFAFEVLAGGRAQRFRIYEEGEEVGGGRFFGVALQNKGRSVCTQYMSTVEVARTEQGSTRWRRMSFRDWSFVSGWAWV